MDPEAARRASRRVGLITLPLGLLLVVAPVPANRFLRLGAHPRALRAVGTLDLALVPGLVRDGDRWQWLAARAALNVGIGTYCVRLARRHRAPGAVVAAIAMVAATAADAPAVVALHRRGR